MSDEPTRFTPRMTATARKRQIVEVALDLIAKHGLQGVTMSRIAAGAGIRQASLYSHFQSRHEILLGRARRHLRADLRVADDPLQREHP